MPDKKEPPKSKNLAIHLVAGGVAGCCEALTCHPLDTIKVRLQLTGERSVKSKPLSSAVGEAAAKAAKVQIVSHPSRQAKTSSPLVSTSSKRRGSFPYTKDWALSSPESCPRWRSDSHRSNSTRVNSPAPLVKSHHLACSWPVFLLVSQKLS